MSSKLLIILIIIAGTLVAGCVGEKKETEIITEYKIVDVSVKHEESAFLSSSSDYISVIYLDENGAVKQQRSNYLGGITIRYGNISKFEKYDYIDENGNFNWMNRTFVLTVTNYSIFTRG